MSDPYSSILLFGAPGVGKGTQGHLLGAIPGFYHFSSGDMFRSMDKNSDLGKTILTYSTKGLLVPDDLTIRLWAKYMLQRRAESAFDPKRQLLLLDGIPRTVNQAQVMAPHLEILQVVHLYTKNEEEMVQRMKLRAIKQNRPDDADEQVIRRRFEIYHAETQPLLDYFPKKKVININAVGSPARVLCDILKHLAPLQEHHCLPWEG